MTTPAPDDPIGTPKRDAAARYFSSKTRLGRAWAWLLWLFTAPNAVYYDDVRTPDD